MKIRLSFIVVMMCLCILACTTGEKGDLSAETEVAGGVVWAQLTLDNAKVQAANQNKLIMIDVFSPT